MGSELARSLHEGAGCTVCLAGWPMGAAERMGGPLSGAAVVTRQGGGVLEWSQSMRPWLWRARMCACAHVRMSECACARVR
eukprot:10282087-Alexandrium_andersonii.AAC.1